MTNIQKTIEVSANAGIILVCMLIGWAVIEHKSPGKLFGQRAERFSIEGEVFPPLAGYSWQSHSQTLVMAIRKGCIYCKASQPFYKRLCSLERANQLHAHLLVVMPDNKEEGASELQSAGLTAESVFDQPLSSLKVSGTPTLLLLDSKGKVFRSWVGQLTTQEENDVMAAVDR
jgi:hypothetical protein